jgi:arylsulfatase A-like enzyme
MERISPSGRRLNVGVSLLLVMLAATGAGCRSRREDFSLFRIIDHIVEKNVVKSPLRKLDPKNSALAEIARGYILEDLGTGPNPFLIKKKLHVGPTDVNALAAVPPTEFKFDLKVPEKSRLEFSYGIRFDNGIFRAEAGARTATFKVVLSSAGREAGVFAKTLTLVPRKTLEFENRIIDLAEYAGKNVTFRLITEGDDQALAFWFNPVVYRVREDARYVILISLDTLRADHLSAYGYPRDTSPNMEALAKDGILFSNVMASAPWTLPSHMSLMTSLNTINHGVLAPEFRLDPGVPTLAEFIKTKGFTNGALTGGGYVSGFFGFNKGFDSFRALAAVTDPDAAERLCRNACRWIEDNRDRDFFLFLHTYQIHNPFYSKEPTNRRYLRANAAFDRIDMTPMRFNHESRFRPVPEEERQNIVDLYDAEIRYTDDSLIGPLVSRLKSLGLYDRTMIVLTSDHGEEFFEHGSWLHTHSVYNEVLRVPLIIKAFRSRAAGKTIKDLARSVDILPTICEELGIPLRPGTMDGASLLPLIDGGQSGKEPGRTAIGDLAPRLMSKHIPGKIALVRFPHKFIFNSPYSKEDLAFFHEPPPPLAEMEIFDLARDPGETSNLAAERQDLVRQFRELMKKLYKPRKGPGARKSATNGELEKQLKTLGYL